MRVVKRRSEDKFEDYHHCLETTQLVNKINQNPQKSNKLILKSQQSLRSQIHNVFTEEVNKIDLSANDDKIMQSIDSVETCVYGTSEEKYTEKKK